MDSFGILGSDSEEEMSSKTDFIAALKLVHQQEGLITLSESDLPRYAPGWTHTTPSPSATLKSHSREITIATTTATSSTAMGNTTLKLKKVAKESRHPTAAMETFEFNDQDDQTRINTSITKK